MFGLTKDNKVYLKLEDLIDRQFVICFGILDIKGFEETKFYLRDDGLNLSIRFTMNPTDSTHCYLTIIENPNVWSGVPVFINVEQIDNSEYINITDWIRTYSLKILQLTYESFNTSDKKDIQSLEKVYTHIYGIKSLNQGIQILGAIKSGESFDMSPYSINHIINLYQLSDTPMIGRVGDQRIGYFYNNFKMDTKRYLTGNPMIIINRLNLEKKPWRYLIDTSIPKEYHQMIKNGVLSWNKYFNTLGLGQPFEVITYENPNYPTEIDVFDTNMWYIVGTKADNFNGPYSGFSMSVDDYRSGENLFGMISLNLLKIISNPTRYIVMNGYHLDQTSEFKNYIEEYVSWIVAHEIGHQLGLRHNFMGNFKKNSVSTVMDYVDIFNDLTAINRFNPWGTTREYDLKAIEYGYIPLENETTGVKHPQLEIIAHQINTPFGTDENFFEKINPLISTIEDKDDPLLFVEEIIPIYHKYRQNLLNFVKNGMITSYEHNTMFIYLYTQKYVDLIDICLKYIGGRYYDKDRTFFEPISKQSIVHALTILLILLNEIEYTDDEYQYFIYDYQQNDDRQLFNRVQLESIYSLNVVNLYYFYQNLVNHVMKGITTDQRITRLTQNNNWSSVDEFSAVDLMYNFTFAVKTQKPTIYDINQINGIFPEIGALLNNDSQWYHLLLDISPLKYNKQYSWIEQLIRVYKKTTNYSVKECSFIILHKIKNSINHHILPYVITINEQYNNKQFWNNSRNKMFNHWSLLSQMIKNIRIK